MTPQQREAHLRMLANLPSRTHEWRPVLGDGTSGIKRAVEYQGKVYTSITALRHELHIGVSKAAKMIERGEVKYVTGEKPKIVNRSPFRRRA
jgi:hypothetical protein